MKGKKYQSLYENEKFYVVSGPSKFGGNIYGILNIKSDGIVGFSKNLEDAVELADSLLEEEQIKTGEFDVPDFGIPIILTKKFGGASNNPRGLFLPRGDAASTAHEIGHLRLGVKGGIEEEENAWRFAAKRMREADTWDKEAKRVCRASLFSHYIDHLAKTIDSDFEEAIEEANKKAEEFCEEISNI